MKTVPHLLLTHWIALSILFSIITADNEIVIDNFTLISNSVFGDRYGEGDCRIEENSIKIGAYRQHPLPVVDLDYVNGLDYTKKAYEFIKPRLQNGLNYLVKANEFIKPRVQNGCLHWQETLLNLPGVLDVTGKSLVITYSALNPSTDVILNLEYKRGTYTVYGFTRMYPYGRASIDFYAVDFPVGQNFEVVVPFSEFKNAALFNAVAVGLTNFGEEIQVHEIKIVNQ